MAKSLEAWKKSVWNQRIDFDNASYDCVDVSKSWIMYLTDKPWQQSAGWGNAKDIYYNWYDTYLERVPRGNAPKLGDIVVMNGQIGGGYGHTGVIVGIDGQNVTIYQQNTFTQQPVYTGVFNAYVSYITGFLRPNGNAPFTVGEAVALQPYQRVTTDIVNYREGPSRSANVISQFQKGDVLDFKGWVRGEAVDGNNIWFVGRHTGGYIWSGGLTDTGTHDLADLNPQTLQPFQRQVGNSVINYRREPKIMPDNVIKTFNPGEILDFDAWTHATNVDGIDVWFRGRYTGGWSHAGGFTSTSTDGLTEVTLDVTVPTPPEPTYPQPTTDKEVTKVYNKKHPIGSDYAPTDLVSVGGGQQLRKEAADSLKLMQSQQTLTPASGYRSYETQVRVYADNVKQLGQVEADRVSARPGYSEHQTGLTMDFAPIEDSFANSAAYAWLSQNAYKYGWVLRYAASTEATTGYSYEPWHWRYVGVTVATDMRNNGIATLEEYYNIEGGPYPEPTEPTDPTDPTEPTDPEYDVNFIVRFFNALVKFIKDFFSQKNK